ncbi:hypothetical protein GCM10027064_05370 [Microbacterium petrolearium]
MPARFTERERDRRSPNVAEWLSAGLDEPTDVSEELCAVARTWDTLVTEHVFAEELWRELYWARFGHSRTTCVSVGGRFWRGEWFCAGTSTIRSRWKTMRRWLISST